MSDFVVKVEYKNEQLETVVEKEYNFIEYTSMLDREIKKVLSDIEDAFFYFNQYAPKEKWPVETKKRFDAIRHKLLDQANAVKRLPQTLSYKGIKANQIPISDFIDQTMK